MADRYTRALVLDWTCVKKLSLITMALFMQIPVWRKGRCLW